MSMPGDATGVSESIALVGYRASGKSSVARRVAERLGWRFVDADKEVERRAGLSIARIFEERGEPAFRDLEEEVIAEYATGWRVVFASGGGAVIRETNRVNLQRFGLVAWLKADDRTLVERLERSPGGRPALTPGGLLAEVAPLLALRNPLYDEVSDVAIETVGRHAEVVADLVLTAWMERRSHVPGDVP